MPRAEGLGRASSDTKPTTHLTETESISHSVG